MLPKSHSNLFARPSRWKTLPRSVLKCRAFHARRTRGSNASLGRAFSRSLGGSSIPDTTFSPNDSSTTTIQKTWRTRKITTLDPSRLTTDDYIDISLKYWPHLSVLRRSDRSSDPEFPRPIATHNPQVSWVPCASRDFPAGTHGFLYYHVPPNGSPLAGELRFRITSSSNPTSFATGFDLLAERNMPWRYPLYKMVCGRNWTDFVRLLLQDGLVSQQTVDLVSAAIAPLFHTIMKTQLDADGATSSEARRAPNLLPSTPVLSAFGQEFPFRYTPRRNFSGIFASPDTIFTHYITHITTFRVVLMERHVPYFPWRGSVVCCFERSTLPEHAGKRVVVLRVKRFIDSDPIRPVPPPRGGDGRARLVEQLRPREGQLVHVAIRNRARPWAADVDKSRRGRGTDNESIPWKALRVFFENEELYRSPHMSAS